MNRFLAADAPQVETVPAEGLAGSPPARVYRLLVNSSLHPLGLEDWLGELSKALGARAAALVALLDREPVAQFFYSQEAELPATVNWPWQCDVRAVGTLVKEGLVAPTRSADGRSSFLTAVLERDGLSWLLSLEDALDRSWSVDEQSALTLAALGLFEFPSVQHRAWADWSERARIQQRLEDAAAVVGRLAHDFNNVLTSVLGFTELSLTHLSPGGSQRKLMAEVFAAAQQGSHLTSQLSLFSTRRKISQDSTTILSFPLGSSAKQWRETWGDVITLEVLVPPDLPSLSIDAESLRMILDKLADNARAAITGSGTIRVSARQVNLSREDCLGLLGKARPGPYVELTVADSGCGFSPDARRRVFAEPFFSTKPRHRGLGLPSVYGVLMNFGGAIRLEHVLEKGTLVRVYLPAAGSADTGAAATLFPGCGVQRDFRSPDCVPEKGAVPLPSKGQSPFPAQKEETGRCGRARS
jgi:signal transduction histidine kinase